MTSLRGALTQPADVSEGSTVQLTVDAGPDLAELLAVTRGELERVDHKAEVLFTGSGVMTGVIVAGALAGQWSPTSLDPLIRMVWWAGVVAWLLSLGCLAAAVYPRIGPGRRPERVLMIAYFLDVARLRGPQALGAALQSGVAGQGAVLIDQVFRVSRLVRTKYRCLQASLWLLVLAVLCGAIIATFAHR